MTLHGEECKLAYLRGIADFKRAVLEEVLWNVAPTGKALEEMADKYQIPVSEMAIRFYDEAIETALDRAEKKIRTINNYGV